MEKIVRVYNLLGTLDGTDIRNDQNIFFSLLCPNVRVGHLAATIYTVTETKGN
jgi:hypothetical protein